ncbi:uncharacterized protein LOC119596888 isoform X2 [Penaeus monodon]|uniref:uncharacterized protein LOC119596888 isoform X2 n=1 Tax=Penaeus monodon TaxID=6687 RepID=UPI0018A6E02D|nr:uncharacterized protein LOC119596888 isoform X2 [Penaeus monodon]
MAKGKLLLPKKLVSKIRPGSRCTQLEKLRLMLPCSPILLHSKQAKTLVTANLYLRWLDGGVKILPQAPRTTDVRNSIGCHARGKNICVHSVRCGSENSAFTGNDAPLRSTVNGAKDIQDACPSPFSPTRRTDPADLRKIRIRRIVSCGPEDRRPGNGAESRPLLLPPSRSRREAKKSSFAKVDGFFLHVSASPPRSLQSQRGPATHAPWPQFKIDLENSPLRRLLDAHEDASLCRRGGCLDLAPRPGEASAPPSPRACLLLSPWNTHRFVPQSPSQFIYQAESFLDCSAGLECSPSPPGHCKKLC